MGKRFVQGLCVMAVAVAVVLGSATGVAADHRKAERLAWQADLTSRGWTKLGHRVQEPDGTWRGHCYIRVRPAITYLTCWGGYTETS